MFIKIKKSIIAQYSLILLICFFITFIIVNVVYKAEYSEKFDSVYIQDLFDHSQWRLARSIRTIGDSALYQLAGFNLIKTLNFFDINPEVPPLGKYLYGLSIILFNNALFITMPLYIICVLLFFSLAKKITNIYWAYIISIIFAFEPIIITQLSQSMLDLPQLTMLLGHIFLIDKLTTTKNKIKELIIIFGLGFTLGFFISIKIGFFVIPIIVVDGVFLWKLKKIKYILPVLLVALSIYILMYLPFFLQGHTINEFIRAQKWMIKFYLSSKITPIYGSAVINLLTGWYKNWSTGSTWVRSYEWTVFWPLYMLTVLFYWKKILSRKQKISLLELYLVLIFSFLLFIFIFIPFWTRYLILIIPLGILLMSKYLRLFPKLILVIVIFIFSFQISLVFFESPVNTINEIQRIWQTGAYQDLYSFLDKKFKQSTDRISYWRKMKLLENNLLVIDRKISIIPINTSFWRDNTKYIAEVKYQTKLGEIITKYPLRLTREKNKWKLIWDYNLALEGYTESSIIEVYFDDYSGFGTLLDHNGNILSYEGKRPFIYVIPEKIRDEKKLQEKIQYYLGLKKYDFEYLYKANNLPDLPAEIGFLLPQFSSAVAAKLSEDPSVIIEERNTRVYSSEIIKRKKIDNVRYFENIYAEKLMPVASGRIVMITPDGKEKVIVDKKSIKGKDVKLTEKESQSIYLPTFLKTY